MATITTEELTLHAAGRVKTFPVSKTASVGAHRFCDVMLDDPDGSLPLRAAVFTSTGTAGCSRTPAGASGHSLPPVTA